MPKYLPVIVLVSLVITASPLSDNTSAKLIIWNVGQGQWLTYQNHSHCLHFDMGGDQKSIDLQPLHTLCHKRFNILYLSHADWDHMNLIKRVLNKAPNLCLYKAPPKPLSPRKTQWLKHIKPCQTNSLHHQSLTQELFPHTTRPLSLKSPNALSRVFLLKNKILIPGDSSQKAELMWAPQLAHPSSVTTLILGHHGSRTSSSTTLLNSLPHLHLAIASARYSKYKHPHTEVLSRLKQRHIPTLRTEDWGNIILELF